MNDFSEYPPDLHEITEKFVRSLQDKRVQVYRTSRREGLIRARMLGAKHATGKVWRLLISVTLSNYSCKVSTLSRHINHFILSSKIVKNYDYAFKKSIKMLDLINHYAKYFNLNYYETE